MKSNRSGNGSVAFLRDESGELLDFIVHSDESMRDSSRTCILRLQIIMNQDFEAPKSPKKYFAKIEEFLLTNRFRHAILTKLSPKRRSGVP